MKENQITACTRCGTCCRKGGPALHEEDLPLIRSGAIELDMLMTIRKGERAYDNVAGHRIDMAHEIVKIRSIPKGKTCIHFIEEENGCRIYKGRPLECRLQACWDSARIMEGYDRGRVDRLAVIGHIQWLKELVSSHESVCSYEEIRKWVEQRENGNPEAASRLTEWVNLDLQYRKLATGKGNLPADILLFLFGRPLTDTLSGYNVTIEKIASASPD